jgi:hypothetical protein
LQSLQILYTFVLRTEIVTMHFRPKCGTLFCLPIKVVVFPSRILTPVKDAYGVESTFEPEVARIAAVMTDFYKNEGRIVLFCCCICVYLHKYFFNLTTLGDLKMLFCACNFSPNHVLKYVKYRSNESRNSKFSRGNAMDMSGHGWTRVPQVTTDEPKVITDNHQ